ncbi:MAG: hypothetical protein PF904_14970 [Kiritimatiellae bacterium]|jgi:hypothetical protein|nr:hypothetical protein [Kiritimatiellia bacterium]
MKLPKQLAKDNIEAEVQAALEKEKFELYSDSGIYIPALKLNPELRKNIFYAKSLGELIIGYEAIEKGLASERKGLLNVDNQSDRISRLLIVSNDGSPRFYRELKFLQHKEGGRVLICRLDVDSLLMGEILGLKERSIKAILVTRKNSVVNVLKSLMIEEEKKF